MEKDINKTRIEVIRDHSIISTVVPDLEEGKDDYKMSSSSSIHSFPTLSINSSNPEINSSFMDFSKSDIVRLSVCNNPKNHFITLFEGEFSKKTTRFENKQNKIVLEVDAIHSFFKLSMLELSSSIQLTGITFGEFVSKLVDMGEIYSKVTINPDLSDIKIMGMSYKTNTFRLFKEVCLMCDAAVSFNTDNSVDIDFRAQKLRKIRGGEPREITEQNIISIEREEKI